VPDGSVSLFDAWDCERLTRPLFSRSHNQIPKNHRLRPNVEGRQVRRILGYYGGALAYRRRIEDVAGGGYRELLFDKA